MRFRNSFAVVAALVVVLGACSKSDEAPVPAGTEGKLSTVQLLALTPEAAGLAIAFPPMGGWYDRSVALAQRVAPEGADVQGWIDTQVADLAREFEVEGAQTFGDIARGVGVDPEAPFAMYFAPPFTAPEGGDSEDAAFACVTYCLEPEKTQAAIGRLGLDGADGTVRERDAHGVTIRTKPAERFSYFLAGNRLVFGTSEALVTAVAARTEHPAAIRYGTEACPVESDDEIVALAWVDRLAEAEGSIIPFFGRDVPDLSVASRRWLSLWGAIPEEPESDDPAIITMRWIEDSLDLQYRIDAAKHPKLAERFGEEQPFAIAPYLPATSELVAAFQLTEEGIASLEDRWIGLLPEELRDDPLYEIAKQQVEQTAGLLEGEVAIGVFGLVANSPGAIVLAAIKSERDAQAFFGAFSGFFRPADEYEGSTIFALPAEMQVPMAYAVHDNVLIAGPNVSLVQSTLAQLKTGRPTVLFETLEPPVGIEEPLRTLIVVPRAFVVGLALPMAQDDLSPLTAAVIEGLAREYKELRIEQSWAGGWLQSRARLVPN